MRIIAVKNENRYPVRDVDWIAYFEGEADTGRYGFGATEEEARADLLSQFAADA